MVSEKVVKSLGDVEAAVKFVEQSFQGIAERTRRVDAPVAEIARASREQCQGLAQVNVAVTEMDKVTHANAAQAEQTAASSQHSNRSRKPYKRP